MLSTAQVEAITPVSATAGNGMLPPKVVWVNSAKDLRFRTPGRATPFPEEPPRKRRLPGLVPRALRVGRWDPLCVGQACWRSHARDGVKDLGSSWWRGRVGGYGSRAMQRPRLCFQLILNNCPDTGDCYVSGPVMSGVAPSIQRRPGHSDLPGTGPRGNASVSKASAASGARYELFDIK